MVLGFGKGGLHVVRSVYEEMLVHARETYPHECCGVLVGSVHKDTRVMVSHRVENTNTERAADRYTISPAELNIIDKQSRVEGMEILGFYHSHPDHPDRPSEYDREFAHPGYSYVIISVEKGEVASVKCWRVYDEDGPFKEEKIKFI